MARCGTDGFGGASACFVQERDSTHLTGHLGRKLREVYSELVEEPIPDKFSALLEQLAKAQGKPPQSS